MNILKQIFTEHFEEIQYILHPRPVVMENIEKMVNCGNPSYGGAMYGCPHCGDFNLSPFAVIPSFALPTVINIARTAPLKCLLQIPVKR